MNPNNGMGSLLSAIADLPADERAEIEGAIEAVYAAGPGLAMVDSGAYQAAFFLRPTRVEQVRELAAAGENMPPKSTFFYPKLLTGLLFNPLA